MKVWVALAVLGATLAAAGGAAANLSVGVNDDASKDPTVAPWFYSTMESVGLRINTLTLLWDESSPSDIAGDGAIDEAIAEAKTSGGTIELDLYPAHSMAFTRGGRCAPSIDPESCGDTSRIQQFAYDWSPVVMIGQPFSQRTGMRKVSRPMLYMRSL